MTTQKARYSILIPSRNGGKYLPTCVQSIIEQHYDNYELVISDDHSDDGTKEYLATLKHKNIRVVEPPQHLSMAEHWEWVLAHATGEWMIFVGQDDGLQPYFFTLADKLTRLADKKNIRAVMSRRAYFFWNGCDALFGDWPWIIPRLQKLAC